MRAWVGEGGSSERVGGGAESRGTRAPGLTIKHHHVPRALHTKGGRDAVLFAKLLGGEPGNLVVVDVHAVLLLHDVAQPGRVPGVNGTPLTGALVANVDGR